MRLLSVVIVAGLLIAPALRKVAAAPVTIAAAQTPAMADSSITKIYYYQGHYYPYRYRGGYYPYRYSGHYYRHRNYRSGHWHYY